MKMRTLKALFYLMVALFVAAPQFAQAKNKEEKVKEKIDQAAEKIKRGVENVGNNLEAAQSYLDNYQWKGIIRSSATSGPIILRHLKLNDHGPVLVVAPETTVQAEISCKYRKEKNASSEPYKVVIGLKEGGPQTVLNTGLTLFPGEKIHENFTLKAPKEPGLYAIRFAIAPASLSHSEAMQRWTDESGQTPDASKTIGVLLVR